MRSLLKRVFLNNTYYLRKYNPSNRHLGKFFLNKIDIWFSWTNLRSKTCIIINKNWKLIEVCTVRQTLHDCMVIRVYRECQMVSGEESNSIGGHCHIKSKENVISKMCASRIRTRVCPLRVRRFVH